MGLEVPGQGKPGGSFCWWNAVSMGWEMISAYSNLGPGQVPLSSTPSCASLATVPLLHF